MRYFPTLRAALPLVALFPLSLCAADMPEVPAEERTASTLPLDEQPAESPTAPAVHLNIIDQKLALSLAVDTWGQIAASEAALPSIRDESLKRLMSTRLETQRAFLAQLETLTGGRCCEAIKQAVDEIDRDAKTETARAVRFRPLALNKNATAMIVRIRVEILQQYTGAINQHLAAKTPEEFDRHFLRADLLHQMQMLAMLNVFAGQASPDFAEVIQSAEATATEQLEQSRQVLVQMETPALVGQPAAVVPLAETASAVAQ